MLFRISPSQSLIPIEFDLVRSIQNLISFLIEIQPLENNGFERLDPIKKRRGPGPILTRGRGKSQIQ